MSKEHVYVAGDFMLKSFGIFNLFKKPDGKLLGQIKLELGDC